MEKLVIQIPCYNEEATLPLVLAELPTAIAGIACIEVQIIDDGSHDATVAVAQAHGVHHIIRHVGNKGLGNAFRSGVEAALARGATIVVNTDADNQYPSRYIPDLVAPILRQEASIVIGDRQTGQIAHFSPIKRFLQKLGSRVTALLSGLEIPDAVSGFRAYSREALLQLTITTPFSYVLDTTIQAGKKRIALKYIPITTNAPTRPSRLFSSLWDHVWKSGVGMMKVYAMYEPLRIFVSMGILFCILGAFPILRFVYYFFTVGESGKVQSLIFGMMFVVIGVLCFGLGIIGESLNKNRMLLEELLRRQRTKIYQDRDTTTTANSRAS